MAVLVAESGEGANVNLRARELSTERLALEPLRGAHFDELAGLLGDARLYAHIGGAAPSVAELRERFARQVRGMAPEGTAWWLNWVLRGRGDGAVIGTVQTTLPRAPAPGSAAAELAWMVGVEHQGAGFAREGASAVVEWLRTCCGVGSFVAHIAPGNAASAAVARRLGMAPSGFVREDGELRWEVSG
jgi:RimJ/RimL family protein N-acetyltransferase